MEILINELSLNGQFDNEEHFLDHCDMLLKMIKLIEKLNFLLLKHYQLFESKITDSLRLQDFLRLKTDRARKMKSFLAKLSNDPPYWNEMQKHDCINTTYYYQDQKVCDTSLAESCERDKIILSFKHNDFNNSSCNILKNNAVIDVFNIINHEQFLEYLFENSRIKPLKFCEFKFSNTKLDFTQINLGYGFDSLATSQQIKEFIEAFKLFADTSWENILKSDGLEYKKYSPNKTNDWFRGTEFSNKNVFKFRVTQAYRCFGYREKDTFFVLRFEIDHKMSDNG